MARTITLINKTRQAQVVQLEHETVCAASGDCRCTRNVVPRTTETQGVSGVAMERKRMPASLTLLAREEMSGLHPAVLLASQVKTGVARGDFAYRDDPTE